MQTLTQPDREPMRRVMLRVYALAGGRVMAHLGRVPSVGDSFEWQGLRVEVVDMDGLRVDKVLVQPVQAGQPTPQES